MTITIYTINDCAFSQEEKEYLKKHNLPFTEKNLETNRDFLTEMLAVSNNFAGTPVTKIDKDNGETVILKGFTPEEFDAVLELTPSSSAQTTPVVAETQPVVTQEVEGPQVAPPASQPQSPAIDATGVVPPADPAMAMNQAAPQSDTMIQESAAVTVPETSTMSNQLPQTPSEAPAPIESLSETPMNIPMGQPAAPSEFQMPATDMGAPKPTPMSSASGAPSDPLIPDLSVVGNPASVPSAAPAMPPATPPMDASMQAGMNPAAPAMSSQPPTGIVVPPAPAPAPDPLGSVLENLQQQVQATKPVDAPVSA